MRTLHSAATLLAGASTPASLRPLLSALGFADAFSFDLPALGVITPCLHSSVARGRGATRALIVVVESQTVHATAAAIAEQLARRAPHLLWLLIVIDGPHLALATWAADRLPPRIAALVIDRHHVVDSDADTLCAMEAVTALGDDTDGTLTYTRWLDVLGRGAMDRRFFRTIERVIASLADGATGRATAADRREIALLYTCRVLFLAFLEAKGWLDGDRAFLTRTFSTCVAGDGGVHGRVLLPLFFGTLNTPVSRRAPRARALGRVPFLNGGLFAPAPAERRTGGLRFSDEALGALFGDLLTRYRFTARETGSAWSEAAVDPAMLGKTFESLMAATERRNSGCFYTPLHLVETATRAALDPVLQAGTRLDAIRVLDPACGSGAFLVHALETIAARLIAAGDVRPVADVRRAVLTQSIFGVDINPTAVWLCELRLWLSVVIDSPESDPLRVTPLPNLDHHVRVGDSLADDGIGCRPAAASIARIRGRYASATGRRKETLRRALDHAERGVAIARVEAAIGRVSHRRRDILAATRDRDLFGGRTDPLANERRALRNQSRALRRELRGLREGGALPFSFAVHFADATDGYDIVLGNPPWVRLHNIPPTARVSLRDGYRTFREAAWTQGAQLARAGAGFAAQVDLAALFVERALSLARPGGITALLVPAKLFRALAGGGLRSLILRDARLLAIDDWSDAEPAFDAATYPALVVLRRRSDAEQAHGCSVEQPPQEVAGDATQLLGRDHMLASIAVHRRGGATRQWTCQPEALRFDASPGSPWVLVPSSVREAFDAVVAAGVPLAHTRMRAPLLGVKSGCNAAFVATVAALDRMLADVRGRTETNEVRRGTIERALLRPLLRGETLGRWTAPPEVAVGGECLVWTHRGSGPLPVLPHHTARWLAPWRTKLRARSDARHSQHWWSLFRTESASTHIPRVVWADVGRAPRAVVLPAGHPAIALNSCYVVRCPELIDAYALAALLNSPLAAAFLNTIAEPARGSHHRYLGWTVALLPIPHDWLRARRVLAVLGERAARGEIINPDSLWDAAVAAYGLDPAVAARLAAWVLGPCR